MLTIRKEQLRELEQCVLDEFRKRMLKQLREGFQECTSQMSDEDLNLFVKSGIKKAQSYGILEVGDIEYFLEFLVTEGEDFEEKDPKTKEILSNPQFDGEEKLEELDIYFNGLDGD